MVNQDVALRVAVQSGTDAEVAELLRSGTDPNAVVRTADDEPAEFKHSPLVLAIVAGSVEKVMLLMAAGADTHDIARMALPMPSSGMVDYALHYRVENWDVSKRGAP